MWRALGSMVIECAPGPGIQDGVTTSLVDDGEVTRAIADGQPCPAVTPLGLFLVCSLNKYVLSRPCLWALSGQRGAGIPGKKQMG